MKRGLSQKSVFGDIRSSMEIGNEDNFYKTHVSDFGFNGFKPTVDGFAMVEEGESGRTVKLEEDESKPESNLRFLY